jgi:hypothetical protein
VRQQRGATVEKEAAVDDDRAVVAVQRKSGTATEKREL